MSAASAIIAGRIAAELLMEDRCLVKRPTGAVTPDPVTLAEVPVYATIWTDMPCRVQRSGALSPNTKSPGGYEFGTEAVLAQLPLRAIGIKRDDVFEVTAIGPVTDPDLLGFEAPVQANLAKTHATKRTLICEQVTP